MKYARVRFRQNAGRGLGRLEFSNELSPASQSSLRGSDDVHIENVRTRKKELKKPRRIRLRRKPSSSL